MTYIQSFQKPDGTQVHYKDSSAGYGSFDQKIDALPPDAVPAQVGSRFRAPYTPEPFATENWAQFGQDLYYHPNFGFCLDEAGYLSVDQRRRYGINLFNQFTLTADYAGLVGPAGKIEWRNQLRPGEGMYYMTENVMGIYAKNTNFFFRPFNEFFENAWNLIPAMGYGEWANYKYAVWNQEGAIFYCTPGQYFPENDPRRNVITVPGWANSGDFLDWNTEKNWQIKLQTTGETITIEQLAARGTQAWENEIFTIRATRQVLQNLILKKKANPAIGLRVGNGFAPYVNYYPSLHAVGSTGAFNDGYSDVSKIGGDAQQNYTFTIPNGGGSWTVNLAGDAFSSADFFQAYHYSLDPPNFMDSPTYQAIFVDKTIPVSSQAEIWARIGPNSHSSCNIGASVKGYLQLNRQIVKDRTGSEKGLAFQVEKIYETHRLPLPMASLQNIARHGQNNLRETPRLEIAPYAMALSYSCVRFMAGNDRGWLFYLFGVDQIGAVLPPNTSEPLEGKVFYNFDLHTVPAILQARRDMQHLEAWYTGSQIIEDPLVQVGQTGNYEAYTGTQALNYNQGGWGADRPPYMVRYKAVSGGWDVKVWGSMRQDWEQERKDNIRIPAVGNCVFEIPLRGPGYHLYEFFVPASSFNQTFQGLLSPVPSREKAGYSGWIAPAN